MVGWTLLMWMACNRGPGQPPPEDPDRDADGVPASSDCDDDDARRRPGAPEVCDGVDNDCDALVDDADPDRVLDGTTMFWRDADGDGFGDPELPQAACEVPEGFAEQSGDCDDVRSWSHPGAPELCDGRDNDCDASTTDQGVAFVSDRRATDWTDQFSDPEAPFRLEASGGTLFLCEGDWYGSVAGFMDLVGLDGSELTSLTGGGEDPTVTVDGSPRRVDGITLVATGPAPALATGEVPECVDVEDVVLTRAPDADAGGASLADLGCYGAQVLQGVTFRGGVSGLDETSTPTGGALTIQGGTTTCVDCVFEANTGPLGAIALLDGTLTVSNTNFVGNQGWRFTLGDRSSAIGQVPIEWGPRELESRDLGLHAWTMLGEEGPFLEWALGCAPLLPSPESWSVTARGAACPTL